ncbi:MAG: hypothetical protein R2867_21300 [Caldilineaceae bacterium]
MKQGAQAHDPDVVDISAGVAVGLIHALEPAGEIVQRIVREAEEILQQRPGLLRANDDAIDCQ